MFFLCESIWHSAMQKAPNVASMFFACIMWGFVIQGHISAELL